MILQKLHKLMREEDGQALVLTAVLMLVVALAVLSISSLGKSIHDRIQLQNAADNTAYTLAAQEARAFNFYAYTNRAQIAQYVTILQVLSVDAMLLGVSVGLGILSALMKTAESICSGPNEAACLAIPKFGWILRAISKLSGVVEMVARRAAAAIQAMDAFIGMVVVPLLVGANLFLFSAQAAFLASTLARLRGKEALRIARKTAPKAELALGETAHTAANSLRFVSSHLEDAMLLFGTDDPPNETLASGAAGRRNYARRGLGELIHASRHGAMVYDRAFPGELAGVKSAIPGVSHLEHLLGLLKVARFKGHTRLHSRVDIQPTSSSMHHFYAQMEKPGYSIARYPTGNSIGANFYLEFGGFARDILEGLGFNQKELASVTSTGGATKGWACGWDPSNPYKALPLVALTIYAPRFTCSLNEGKHPWWGLTPYMAFDSTKEGCDEFRNDFCQPDVFVALHQPAGSAADRGVIETRVDTPWGKARATSLGEGNGPTAVSRSLVTYHRPGSWKEPPNFFNPHWRAKLAPVQPGLSRLADELAGELRIFGDLQTDLMTH